MSDFSHSDDTEVHYPTTVVQRQFEGVNLLNGQLLNLINSLRQRFGDTEENAVKSGLISTQGGYQTSTRMNLFTVDDPAIATFREQMILPAVRTYLERTFAGEAEGLSPWPVGWANMLQAGDWQGPHFHPTPGNLASGVYYVQLPDSMPSPQGHIEFLNPMPASIHHGFPSTRRLAPKTGKLILFPPYYVHYVHPFKGEGDRAIIAFDVLAKKPGLDLVF